MNLKALEESLAKTRTCVLLWGIVVWIVCLTSIGCGDENGIAEKAPPTPPGIPTFMVGAAVVSVDPTGPVYSGGNGLGPPITTIHDPLSVRAFYVGNGTKALAFAVADSQGWFASYQEGVDLGITGVRALAAAAISGFGGPPLTQADVIVQASHSHAAPTVQGVWGPVPPEYLELLHDRTVEALTSAARNARPALLQWATIDASFLNNLKTGQYDSYPGWAVDGQLSALRAVSPDDGATLLTFVNVPAHPDIVCGSCLELLSADYEGVVRDELEAKLGGVSVVGPATLGRQETPVQALGLDEMEWLGGVVTSLTFQALSDAQWVTDATIASAESFGYTKATNIPLVILNVAWTQPPEVKDQIAQVTGKYPINRSVEPPYLDGSIGGTWLTAARIGGLVYLSMPGEPFPEITMTIAQAVQGADAVVSLSKAQDDLGYFYPSWVYPFTSFYPSDHGDFNVSTEVGDLVIAEHLSSVAALGFTTVVPSSTHLPTDWAQGWWPGVQAMASPMQGSVGDDGTLSVALQAIYEPATFDGHDIDGMVEWDFDDGSTAMTEPKMIFTHAFPVGHHTVSVRASDTSGKIATWSLAVRAYPQLRAQFNVRSSNGRDVAFTGSVAGGQGNVLAWQWTFSDGGSAAGQTVTHHFARGAQPSATLMVTDGSGTTAAANAEVTE